jgi:phosphohistidine swiveling domain-containing protein
VERLVDLEDDAATRPEVVGAKVARLAIALRAGLPVLRGWALPLEASTSAVGRGAEARRRSGRPAAIAFVSEAPCEPWVLRELAAIGPGPFIVRSSTELDGDGRWAGAFATYHDVDRDLLPTAVRGCWASTFSEDVAGRSAVQGIDRPPPRVAALIQPWLALEAGGIARIGSDEVAVTVSGAPSGVVRGSAGGISVVVRNDGTPGHRGSLGTHGSIAPAAATLARRVHRETGDTVIEWGLSGGELWLLQAGRPTPARPVLGGARVRHPVFASSARAIAIAQTASRFSAPLGDELVLPWAIVADRVPVAEPMDPMDSIDALADARAIAGGLAASAWERTAPDAIRTATVACRDLLGPDPAAALAGLPDPRSLDPRLTGRLVGLVDLVAQAIGRVVDPGDVWRYSIAELEAALRDGIVPPTRSGPDRWEPFSFQAVHAAGAHHEGSSAAPGIGAGPVHVVGGQGALRPPRARSVVVAAFPDPHLAPLLWRASAVVVAAGGSGAHLFEVARSLGIPAVTGVDLRGRHGGLAAVDGDEGSAWTLPCPPTPPAPEIASAHLVRT